mmetsp:Transcript_100/g.149  ORF Transcript_100/g.149 Transcript_100/m.149 type:complete len:145 (-) Transcript_100:1947-2381(-)
MANKTVAYAPLQREQLREMDDYGEYKGMTFTTKTYDVACILPKTLCCVVQTLNLLPNEVEFHSNCCYGFTQISRRVPYGELAGIEKIKCCWFSSFKAGALTSKTEKGAEVPFCPGKIKYHPNYNQIKIVQLIVYMYTYSFKVVL